MVELAAKVEQRTGEIFVFGSAPDLRDRFISSICPEVRRTDIGFTFGQLRINEGLDLFLYGLEFSHDYAWELMARKMVAFLALVRWQERESIRYAGRVIDFMRGLFDPLFLICAEFDEESTPLHPQVKDGEINISTAGRLLFYSPDHADSQKRIMRRLFELLIQVR